MKVITLKRDRVIDGRLRVAGEVVQVPDDFNPRNIARVLQTGDDDMAEKVRRKRKQEQDEAAITYGVALINFRMRDAPAGNIVGNILIGDKFETIEILNDWWHVSRWTRNGSELPLPSSAWANANNGLNIQIVAPPEEKLA